MTMTSYDPAKIPASQDALIAGALAQFSRRLSDLEATAGRIGANTLRGDNYISNNSITAAQIRAGSITADRLNVSSLDAITATLGNIVAGNITLNAGSWIRTAPIGGSVAYTEFSPAGIRAQDSTGTTTFNLSSSTGILTATAVLQTGSTVPGGTITTGSLDLSKLAGDLAMTVSTKFASAFTDLKEWILNGGTLPTITNDATALSGGTLAKMNGSSWIVTRLIPFDPALLYRMRARVRQTVASTVGGNGCYIGIQCFDANQAYITDYWVAANGLNLPISASWSTVSGYFRGTGSSGFTPAADAGNPTPLPVNTKYFRLALIGNWSGGNGTTDFDFVSCEQIEVPANSITSSKLYAGSVEADRIQTANLAAGSVTAAKISATIAGGNLLSTATTGFEQDLSGWTTGAVFGLNSGSFAARDTTVAYYGSASMKLVTTAAAFAQGAAAEAIPGPWRAGQKYTASAYVYSQTSGQALQMFLCDDGGADTSAWTQWNTVANTWYRATVTWSPTVDYTNARLFIRTAAAYATTFFVDAVQIEQGDIATAWRQYVSPVVIEGSRITAADFRTNLTGTRLQIDDTVGVASYVGGVITSQLKPGAGGLDIQAHTASGTASPTERTVRWLSGANAVGIVEARRDATSSALWIDAYRAAASTNTYAGLTAHNGNTPSGSNYATVEVAAEAGTYTIYLSAGASARTLLRQDGASSFIQGINVGDRKMNYGVGTASFGGTGTAETTVSHGLGRTPAAVFITVKDGQGVYYSIATQATKSWTSTTFVATVQLISGTNAGSVNFSWVAIG